MDKNKIFLINRGKLEGRLDSYYYNEVFLNNEVNLHKIGYTRFGEFIKIITKGSTPEMISEGIPFLKVLNMNEFGIKTEKLDFISLKIHESMRRSQLYGDEILYSMAGTIGIAVNYDKKFEQANINQAIAKIVLNDKSLNILMVYLLNSKLCNLQAKRFLTVSAQPNINFEQIKSIKIPKISEKQKIDIINIMNKAYESKKQKEKEAQDLLDGIDDYLFDKLGITLPNEPENNIENRTFKVGFDDIFANRLDCDYFTKYYQDIEKSLEECQYKILKLGSISKNIFQGIGQNLTNIEKNILLKVKNIKQNNEIDFEDTEFIGDIPKNKILLENDIITPFIGEAIKKYKLSVFNSPNTYFDYTVDNNTGVIRLDSSIANAEFVSSFFISKIGKQLISRLIGGGGVPFLGSNNAKKLILPLPDISIQNEIVDKIKQRRQKAKQLQNKAKLELENAKKEVEKLILGDSYEC
ncbi:restriction endonuclease subunit S [Aliarcobacter butzleri]|uniref:restriction endonuclease subunit S n=1 Tax=Aliarcobacter butzleri TaxID=28197 RepID=UPI001EDBD6C7|nr:restriction endonuclease subunit S [Aliarcobacter butzleri]MCG3663404.1 restriction endonuclease subunit S [Aliarcobacter butzleri]